MPSLIRDREKQRSIGCFDEPFRLLINEKPELLNKQLTTKLNMSEDDEINWLSPLKKDRYAEY